MTAVNRPDGSDKSIPLWYQGDSATAYPPLAGDARADVVIVGGGLTGITAAYLIASRGASVILLEKGRLAMSETGHTTAHIVDATDADYRQLVHDHGEEGARRNTDALRAASQQIRQLVSTLGIDCDLQTVNGYLYAEDPDHREYLERQKKYLAIAGVETEWVDQVPLPFPTIGGLKMPNQQMFHIRKYLLPLADAASRAGAVIHEQTHVTDVEGGGDVFVVTTERGTVRGRVVLLTSHVPINDRGTLWAKMHTTRTYVVAAPYDASRMENALYWDTIDPYHYTRLQRVEGRHYLIVGGADRDVGKEGNDESRYEELEDYCRTRFGVTEFSHRWSGQINEPADMIPFIGESAYGKNVRTATGYSGTGMTYGTIAAMILADFATGRDNPYASLFDTSRTKLGSVLENVVTKATEFPKRLIEKVLDLDVDEKDFNWHVEEGEGKIIERDGKKIAVSCVGGTTRQVSAACTHMGCTVAWNGAEKSWDCPCHGSRFDADGKVLNTPATTDLERVE